MNRIDRITENGFNSFSSKSPNVEMPWNALIFWTLGESTAGLLSGWDGKSKRGRWEAYWTGWQRLMLQVALRMLMQRPVSDLQLFCLYWYRSGPIVNQCSLAWGIYLSTWSSARRQSASWRYHELSKSWISWCGWEVIHARSCEIAPT